MSSRPRSIYERLTRSTLPPPFERVRSHTVMQGESLISIANLEYGLSEYNADLWRDMGVANNVMNPFTVDTDFRGKALVVPPEPLPEFL